MFLCKYTYVHVSFNLAGSVRLLIALLLTN